MLAAAATSTLPPRRSSARTRGVVTNSSQTTAPHCSTIRHPGCARHPWWHVLERDISPSSCSAGRLLSTSQLWGEQMPLTPNEIIERSRRLIEDADVIRAGLNARKASADG